MPTWTFMRHGQSVANREGWLAGHLDAPLTERGRDQAIAARRQLTPPLPTRAFCSDLSRAHHTAKLVLAEHDIPLIVTPQLRERSCGAWERRSVAEIAADEELYRFMNSWTGRPPRGESLLDVALRAIRWLATIDDSTEDTLIVAHGALMRAVLGVVDRRSRSGEDPWRPENCEAIQRELAVSTWTQLLDELRDEAISITSS